MWEKMQTIKKEKFEGKLQKTTLYTTKNCLKEFEENEKTKIIVKGKLSTYTTLNNEDNIHIVHQDNNSTYIAMKNEVIEKQENEGISETLSDFMSELFYLLNYYKKIFFPAVVKYMKDDEIIKDKAKSNLFILKAACEKLGVDGVLKNELLDVSFDNDFIRKNKNDNFSMDIYRRGFTTFLIEPQSEIEGTTKILMASMDSYPEKIISDLIQNSKNNFIFLVSATSNVKTLYNFDLNYLEKRIGGNFFNWNKNNKNHIEEQMNYKTFKEKVNYSANSYPEITFANNNISMQEYVEESLTEILEKYKNKNKESYMKRIAEILEEKGIELKRAKHYLDFISQYLKYLKEDATAGLFIFQINPKKDICDELSKETEKYLNYNKRNSVFALNANDLKEYSEKRENNIANNKNKGKTKVEDIKSSYTNGKNIIVVTSFATMGKAVNFTFKARDINDLIFIPHSGLRFDNTKKEVGFDFLAIGDIRHLFSILEVENKLSEDKIKKTIKILSEIFKANELSWLSNKQTESAVIKAFIDNHNLKKTHTRNILLGEAFGVYRMVNQVIGRLFRTSYFHKKMNVLVSDLNLKRLSLIEEYDREDFTENPLLEEVVKLSTHSQISENEIKMNNLVELENSSNKSSARTNYIINTMFSQKEGIERSEARKTYEEISKLALMTGPFITKSFYNKIKEQTQDNTELENMFVSIEPKYFNKIKEGYYYRILKIGKNEYVNTCFKMDEKKGEVNNFQLVSPKENVLTKLLTFKGFKDYCHKNNVITNFNDVFESGEEIYIMNPYIYNSFYKGRIGEFFGEFLFSLCNIDILRHEDEGTFEYSDYAVKDLPSTFVDFKCYKTPSVIIQELADNKNNNFKELLKRKSLGLNADNYEIVNVFPSFKTDMEESEFKKLINEEGEIENNKEIKVHIIQATYMDNEECKLTSTFKEYAFNLLKKKFKNE